MTNTNPQSLIDRAREGQLFNLDDETALYEALDAAMFKCLGHQTKISRSGYSVVLANPAASHRSDMPSEPARALAWLDANDISTADITMADVEAYRAWWGPVYQARRVGQAKFLITAPFATQRGRELVPANRVALIDGWGEAVAEHVVLRSGHYSRAETNDYTVQNVAAVRSHIEALRAQYPEFAGARIQDNDSTPRA
ncbi:hypothetical protein ACSI5F_03785 [Ralstonia pseudosolanacearum]|uniref:hypothetical protein n=1 Tax=Ralstonia pseudosolanacearum TaxID=1310165 RepID=UPI003EE1D364